jgi:hypothetical protein
VAVEKGTKAVICVNFSACSKRRFNNLRANFVRETPRKEFFNTHSKFHSKIRQYLWRVGWNDGTAKVNQPKDGAIARDWTKQAANSTRERFYSMTTRSTIHLSLRKP